MDNTLRWRGKYGRDRSDHEYIGVPFKDAFEALDIVCRKGTYGCLDDWQAKYPLFRRPWDSPALRPS